MTTTAPSTGPTTARAVGHVLLAGLLGVVTTVTGGPIVVASLFGGIGGALAALGIVTAVVALLAVGLDRVAGPGALGRPGSTARGLMLGVLGTLAVATLAGVALRQDIGSGLPDPLRLAAAALPFAALAALQWRGPFRIATALVVVAAAAVVVVPWTVEGARDHRTASIVTEVGTTAHPWVTEVDGFTGATPQVTGSELIWTPYRRTDGGLDPALLLFRDGGTALAIDGDPCAAFGWWTPEGDHPMTSCTTTDEERWRRTSEYWQQILERRGGEWVGVAARLDVPGPLLEEAVANARPMTEKEYDAWIDEVFTSGPGAS